MAKMSLLGRIGVWLCDRNFPRPSTKSEHAQCMQYVGLMIEVLRGEVTYYGRDRETDTAIVSERRVQ
jgi:hypothetical protein